MVITLLLHHKENEDQGEFMNAHFEGAIQSLLSHTREKTIGLVHKYEAVFGSFVDIGIVLTFLSFT